MEREPEYYKNQAKEAQIQLDKLKSKLILKRKAGQTITIQEGNQVKNLKNQVTQYTQMYNDSLERKERERLRILRMQENYRRKEASKPQVQPQVQPQKKKSLIDLLKEKEARKREQQLQQTSSQPTDQPTKEKLEQKLERLKKLNAQREELGKVLAVLENQEERRQKKEKAAKSGMNIDDDDLDWQEEDQEKINKFLQRGVPRDEDFEDELAELGGPAPRPAPEGLLSEDDEDSPYSFSINYPGTGTPTNLPEVPSDPIEIGKKYKNLPNAPSHKIEIGKKPNTVNPSVPPPPPPLTDEYNEGNLPIVDESINAGPFDDDPDIVVRPEEIGQQLLNIKNEAPIKSTVRPSVKGPPKPPRTRQRNPVPIGVSVPVGGPVPVGSVEPVAVPVRSSTSSEPIVVPPYADFTKTLKKSTKPVAGPLRVNPDICKNIFTNGSKVTKKHFYPSEFPKLTKIKPITVTMKKGGKRKTRKFRKKC